MEFWKNWYATDVLSFKLFGLYEICARNQHITGIAGWIVAVNSKRTDRCHFLGADCLQSFQSSFA